MDLPWFLGANRPVPQRDTSPLCDNIFGKTHDLSCNPKDRDNLQHVAHDIDILALFAHKKEAAFGNEIFRRVVVVFGGCIECIRSPEKRFFEDAKVLLVVRGLIK